MLDLQRVSKSYGRFRAVTSATFRLEPGEIAGLLGPNGAGKTTTIRMITGFLPPDQGSITVAGNDTVLDSLAARRLIGYLPESAPLYPEMTPASYLSFRARLYKLPAADRGPAVNRALDRCWLGDVANKRIGQLSKGYRQRVGLAAAILHDPRVLILDEPTNALDPTQVRETRRLIADLARDRVVLLSSHILAEVELVCSRVIVMVRGKIRADGPPARLIASAATTCRAEWVSPPGAADAIIADLRSLPGVSDVSSTQGPGGHTAATIESAAGAGAADLLDAIGRVLHARGARVTLLTRRDASLERLFVELVEQAADDREAA
ncbi:MAG: multidrug ABC transporter ATP-binding protein [Phycisphaerae bacterium]